MINKHVLVSTAVMGRKRHFAIWICCLFSLLSFQASARKHFNDEKVVYVDSFELRDVYGTKGTLQFTDGCVAGDAENCVINIFAPAKGVSLDDIDPLEEPSYGYINYLSHLKRTGQTLTVKFTPILTDIAAEVVGYRVYYSTENTRMTMVKRIDPLVLPSALNRNLLLLYSVLATHQSSLDLMLSPARDLYIQSLDWLAKKTMRISVAGRGGNFGYRYYSFPKDNELFLDLGGPLSINSLSEGAAFSFPTSDKTIPPSRMVTGYHSDQREWFITRASILGTYATVFGGFGLSIWQKNPVGVVMSLLIMLVELRTDSASSELQSLATRLLPESLQFNPRYQGRYILKVLRSEFEEIESLL